MTGGRGITRRGLGMSAGAAWLTSLAPVARAAKGARPSPYMIGADVTWIPEDEASGATYYQDGVRKDPLDILRDAGFNALKLRLFVNPEDGYSKGKPGGPWGGLAQTITFAKRIKAAGFRFSLSLHYADGWADPQHQDKPRAWAALAFPKLVETLHAYTRDTFAALRAADVLPDFAVIGNEATFGILWPEGRVPLTIPTGNPNTDTVNLNVPNAGGYDQFAALLKAGIAGVKAQAPGTKIVIHNHLGRHWPIVQHWTNQLLQRGVRCDAVGFSCYQQAAQGDWERTFTEFTRRYPQLGFLAIEYSSRKRYLNDLVHAQPHGWGSFAWEPTRYEEAIFTRNGRNAGGGPKPELIAQGLNGAEAPGGVLGATPPPAPPPEDYGGRYDADPQLIELYRTMARDYSLARLPLRRH
jgi:arabinogalactan endo-1,4-beta-galactosidase